MLVREAPDGSVLAITQPAHAAVAGRIARAWDDDVAPDLLLAATHHDDVWAERDATPPLDPATGRPQSFLDLSDEERVAVWRRAADVAEPLGPEAEVWVLRHSERLHRSYDGPAVKAMTAATSQRIDELVAELRERGPRFDDTELARGTSLLALWDTLSLRLCLGIGGRVAAGVLQLAPAADDVIEVTPWPFAGARVEAGVEARRLPGRCGGQEELDAAWAAAEPFTVPLALVRGG